MNKLPEPTRLTLYVDGSCDGNQNVDAETPAGWGVAIILGDSGLGRGSGDVVTELYGPVVTSPAEAEFIGAEVGSNNTAELSGFFVVLTSFSCVISSPCSFNLLYVRLSFIVLTL